MTTTTDWYHEQALKALDIDAEAVIDGAGRVLVATTSDALDDLLEGVERIRGIDDTLNEVESEAHDAGQALGREEGYEGALSDIDNESGDAWEVVSKLVKAAYDDGYQAACDDIAELA